MKLWTDDIVDFEDDEDDTRTCPFCGDVMFNEDGLWICCSCGGDADPDEEDDDWG